MSNNTYKPWLYSFFLLYAMIFSACSPITKPEQPELTSHKLLTKADIYGQTFLSRFNGLSGVELFLSPVSNNSEDRVILNLYSSPYDSADLLAQGTLPVKEITSPGYVKILFPTIQKSTSTDYYLELIVDGSNKVNLGSADGETYINGSLYLNETPIDNQLAFRLIYDPLQLYWGLLMDCLGWGWLLILGGWLYITPGWAILSILLPRWANYRWPIKLGLSIGVSLALYPVLLLWTNIFDLQLGRAYAWIPSLIGLIIIIWSYRESIQGLRFSFIQRKKIFHHIKPIDTIQKSLFDRLPDILLVLVLILLSFSRFWSIRNLDAPMWGDSYQHTMIAQLLVDNGGLFESWEPYVPYHSLTVHYGFHTAVALFTWLTSSDIVARTLQVGQLVNIFAVITLLPLALRFCPHNRWAGLGIVLIAGLLSQMPAYYVNWGRYPQLAGQTILPVSIWLLWESVGSISSTKNFNFRKRPVFLLALTAIVVSGMLLAYYRMAFYFVFFILAWLAIYGILQWKLNLKAWIQIIFKLATIAITSLIIILPWILNVMGSTLAEVTQAGVSTGSSWEPILAEYRIWRDIFVYTPPLALIASVLATIWGIYKKAYILLILPVWFIFLAAYITGKLFGVPGTNMLQNFTLIISIYIPIGLLAGWLVDEIGQSFEQRLNYLGSVVFTILILVLAFPGARRVGSVTDPNTYTLVTRPDKRAMSWINEYIPDNSRFLVEGYRIYGGWTAVGSDAGWWISLLTNNENSMPPQYALMNEAPNHPEYSKQVIDLVANLEEVSLNSNDGTQILCKNDINYIYIGQGQGKTGIGAQQLFSPEEMDNNPNIDLIYWHDRIYIYKFNQDACERT